MFAPSPMTPSPRYARWFALAPWPSSSSSSRRNCRRGPPRRCRSRGAGARTGRSARARRRAISSSTEYGLTIAPAPTSTSVSTQPTSTCAPAPMRVAPRRTAFVLDVRVGLDLDRVVDARAAAHRDARALVTARECGDASRFSASNSCARSLTPTSTDSRASIAVTCCAALARALDDVGQVELALRVVRLERRERFAEKARSSAT